MKRSQYDNPFIGFAIGACFPVIAFFAIEAIFALLESMNIIDELTQGISSRRSRSLYLFALCANIIPTTVLNRQRWTNAIRGLVFATFVYMGVWFYAYSGPLLANF